MRRREFITLLGGAATWPNIVRAQQRSSLPIIGFLNSGAPTTPGVDGFREGLRGAGYLEGTNVAIEYRFAEGRYELLPALVSELMQRPLALLAATGGVHTPLAAKHASAIVPMIFVMGVDPVQFGLVQSLSRPGGNITGVTFLTTTLEAKRFGILRELVPSASSFGVLINPSNAGADLQTSEVEEAARNLGVSVTIMRASDALTIEAAFETLAQRTSALLVAADPFFFGLREKIIALAAQYKLPSMHEWRQFVEAGALASYGTRLKDAYRQAGMYAARILRGEKPADLPVVQSSQFEFVINVKTAKALGLTIPNAMQLLADQVID